MSLKEKYTELCQYYNVLGFPDLIIRATSELEKHPYLCEKTHIILDEYQDFNQAEENLIIKISENADETIIVGDDDQVLYETLKFSLPKLIQDRYKNKKYTKAMLPFCGRSGYHISKTAKAFIGKSRTGESIKKVYLPVESDENIQKIRIIGCSSPASAVDYIKRFIDEHKSELDYRKMKLHEKEAHDPFLLILSPKKGIKYFYSNQYESKYIDELMDMVRAYGIESNRDSNEAFSIRDYYLLALKPENNFYFRKVLDHERLADVITSDRVMGLIAEAMSSGKYFSQLSIEEVIEIMQKSNKIKIICDSEIDLAEKISAISKVIQIKDIKNFEKYLSEIPLKDSNCETELNLFESPKRGAVEIMTIAKSKGLSADHVIIIGFDDINMKKITTNAFYVAITRARKSLHIITTLKSQGSSRAHKYLDSLPDEHLDFCKHTKQDGTKMFSNKNEFNDYLKKNNFRQRKNIKSGSK